MDPSEDTASYERLLFLDDLQSSRGIDPNEDTASCSGESMPCLLAGYSWLATYYCLFPWASPSLYGQQNKQPSSEKRRGLFIYL